MFNGIIKFETRNDKMIIFIFQNKSLEWFPRLRALSLDKLDRNDEENDVNYLKNRLEETNNLIINLSKQLEDIKESVIKLK